MTYAKAIGGVALFLGTTVLACASSFDSAFSAPSPKSEAAQADGGGSGASDRNGGDGTGSPTSAGAPQTSGLLVVHAATFPGFRLCFGNQLNQLPQPDSKIMPEANVVGVETGSVVRLDPMAAPGVIWVIPEQTIRLVADKTCQQLLEPSDGTAALLGAGAGAFTAGRIDEPLGMNRVDVLVIRGCAGLSTLNLARLPSANCDKLGTGRAWDDVEGNLATKVISLDAGGEKASASTLPVQLLHVAPSLAAEGQVNVTFGVLGGAAPMKPVASKPKLLEPSTPVTLELEQTKESVFGTYGFRISVLDGKDAVKKTFDQSLVAIQDLSSPRDLPTSYYQAASNYVLLLLGDPTIEPDAGTANRAVHLVAVPVVDPASLDAGAGADAAAPSP